MSGLSFVYCIGLGSGRPVKLGHSANPVRRFSTLQSGHHEELILYWAAPGTKDDERDLHERYAARLIRNEWFSDEADDLKALRQSAVCVDADDPRLAETRLILSAAGRRGSRALRELGFNCGDRCTITRIIDLPVEIRRALGVPTKCPMASVMLGGPLDRSGISKSPVFHIGNVPPVGGTGNRNKVPHSEAVQ